MKRLLSAVVLMALAAGPAAAGSWPRGKGQLYLKLGTSYLTADKLATPSGDEVPIPEYTRWEGNLYLEYGLSDRWTLLLDAPFYRSSEIERFDEASGVGDLRFGVQRQLRQRGPWLFAARAWVQAPTGDETLGEGVLPTGSGVWEGEVWLSAGRSFAADWRGWYYLEGGYQLRGSGLTDGIVYRTQLGYHLSEHLGLAFSVWGVEPFEQRGTGAIGSVAGLGDGVRYLAYGPSLFLGLAEGWAIQVDVDGAERIRNFASGVTYRLGISFQR